MARITQIGRVITPSPDQDASIASYTEKLGFAVAADVAYGDGYRRAGWTVAWASVPE